MPQWCPKHQKHTIDEVCPDCEQGLRPPHQATAREVSMVNHPPYYGGADNQYEAIKVIEAWGLGFCLGNAIKYICRAGKKDTTTITDLEKAKWYLDREIQRLKSSTTAT